MATKEAYTISPIILSLQPQNSNCQKNSRLDAISPHFGTKKTGHCISLQEYYFSYYYYLKIKHAPICLQNSCILYEVARVTLYHSKRLPNVLHWIWNPKYILNMLTESIWRRVLELIPCRLFLDSWARHFSRTAR